MHPWMRDVLWMIGLFIPLGSMAAPVSDGSMIVLDASGSMWGKIAEGTKISVARTAVHDLIARVVDEISLGRVAYGHRRKSDFEDIAVLVPVGDDPAAIAAAVDATNPVGMTPLTASVEAAVAHLGPTGDIVLVSDGEETCGRDPCAYARALRESGRAITVHVITFHLGEQATASIACLARETGGEAAAGRRQCVARARARSGRHAPGAFGRGPVACDDHGACRGSGGKPVRGGVDRPREPGRPNRDGARWRPRGCVGKQHLPPHRLSEVHARADRPRSCGAAVSLEPDRDHSGARIDGPHQEHCDAAGGGQDRCRCRGDGHLDGSGQRGRLHRHRTGGVEPGHRAATAPRCVRVRCG